MRYYLLALIYTYKCTSSCDICTYSCSPERSEKMDFEDAKRYIREAKEAGMKMIGIAGGEPFLFFDEIVELARYAKSLKLVTTLTTNCFWAQSYDKACEVLKILQEVGVSHLKISADDFHAKEVPYENIKNILNGAKDMNFRLALGCTSTKNSARLKGLLEHIQDEAVGINLIEQTCYPLGRARETFKEEDFIYRKGIDKSCRDKGMLIITPDASVYPCGSMCSNISNRLVGSASEESLLSLIQKSYENKHNKFINTYGIKPYYDYIKEDNLPIKMKEEFIDSCHACYEIFNNHDIAYLDKIVEDLEGKYSKESEI